MPRSRVGFRSDVEFLGIQKKSCFVNEAFPNPQGLFPPLNPTSSANPYHSLSCVAVSLLGMRPLLDGKGLKSRTKILFLPLSLLLTANPSPMCVDYNDVGHMCYKTLAFLAIREEHGLRG